MPHPPKQVAATASLWTLAARPNLGRMGNKEHALKLSDIYPATAIPIPEAPPRAPPAVSRPPVACGTTAGSMEAIRLLADEHERIARGLNDVVVRRLFSAGLDLQAALNLIGDHRVAGKIEGVLDELDLAIRDLRNTIFDRRAT